MAEIKAFKGMRYTAKDKNSLVCPPYDIISDKQREQYIENDPHNIIRLELPKGGDGRRERKFVKVNKFCGGGVTFCAI